MIIYMVCIKKKKSSEKNCSFLIIFFFYSDAVPDKIIPIILGGLISSI